MAQTFRVFMHDGTHIDVEADTFGRDGDDWVLYRGFGSDHCEDADRFRSSTVNGIALRNGSRR
jgi:hypothetical protein